MAQQPTKWTEFLKNFSVFQFVFYGFIALFVTWTTIQVSQASMAKDISTNSGKIEKLEEKTVSRELFDERMNRFDERTKTIIDTQKAQGDILQKILEKR